MKANKTLSIQNIAARHKFSVAVFVVGTVSLIVISQALTSSVRDERRTNPTCGCATPSPTPSFCDTSVTAQTPIPELNGTYTPQPSYPTGNRCTDYSDLDCKTDGTEPCQGGLYVGNPTQGPCQFNAPCNQQPTNHVNQGINRAMNQVYPRDSNGGTTGTDLKIVFLSIGMCNAWLKFGHDRNSFTNRLCGTTANNKPYCKLDGEAGFDKSLNTSLVVVNGAQSGEDAKKWADPTDLTPWTNITNTDPLHPGYLAQAGVTAAQVQVIWMENALIFDAHCENTACDTDICTIFPDHAEALKRDMETMLQTIHTTFQNCSLVYLSPRAYAYTTATHNPEPKAYQTGFADKWVIMDQISNRNNMGLSMGLVPWISWGPYLWTNGATMRQDKLQWFCPANGNGSPSDVKDDMVHPSDAGVSKVANQLEAFFKTDPTTTPWFLTSTQTGSATISVSPGPYDTNSDITLTGSASGLAADHWFWNFDDGETTILQNNFSRKFPIPGNYTIRLTAVDSRTGNHATTTLTLTVISHPH